MVNLSGGNEGGNLVDGTGWSIGSEMTFNGSIYRRIADDQAIFVGMA